MVEVDEPLDEYFDGIASGRGSAPCMGMKGDEETEEVGGNDGLELLMNEG